MRIAITGSEGFLGTHLRAALRAEGSHEVVALGRPAFHDEATLADAIRQTDAVVHLAGVNRADPEVIEAENRVLAERLTGALDALDESPPILFANSIHAGSDTPYGRGKQEAADVLAAWADKRETAFVDIVYQNLFGEGGRPNYNSFVATFCDRLASGLQPEIQTDRPIELIHAQDAAQIVIDQLGQRMTSTTIETKGVSTTVNDALVRLQEISQVYASGKFPDFGDPFDVQLFNTYRSFLYPQFYPYLLPASTDNRGAFVEAVQSLGGESQASFSTTRPGITRGNHFHLRKVERFLVVKGDARIAIRPIYGGKVQVFEVSGERPAFVDMPTLHTHNITNIGDSDLYTFFWANEIYDPQRPDTFIEPVE